MDESVVKQLAQQKITFSDALRKGIRHVPETPRSFCGCAIGTAYWYKTGKSLSDVAEAAWRRHSRLGVSVPGVEICAEEFGMPAAVMKRISDLHEMKGWSREACADYAEQEGF